MEKDATEKNRTLRPLLLTENGRFNERLIELIGDRSLRSLSRTSGISDTTLRKYVTGDTEPTLSKIKILALVLDTTEAWLLSGVGEKFRTYKPFKKLPWGENHEHDAAWVYAEAKLLGTLKPKQEQWFNDFLERNKLSSNQFQKYFEHMESNGNQAHASTSPLVKKEEFDEEFALIPGYHVCVSAGMGSINDNEPIKRHLAFRKKWLSYRKLSPDCLVVVFAKGDSMEPTINNGNSILVDTSTKALSDGSIYAIRLGDQLYAKRLQKRFDGSVELISDNKEYNSQIVPKEELEQLDIIGKVVWIGKDLF